VDAFEDQGELQGRIALVSGSASGIGAAIVERFRRAGAKVAGLDLVESGSDCDVVADLRDGAAVADALRSIEHRLGAPDILVHAAAASFHGGCLDTDPAVFLDLYDVNVGGAVRLLQASVPGMRRGGGSIVMLSSINARFATPTLAAYAATKAALENLVQTAALELAPDGIRVNAIAPASIDTPAMRASYARSGDAAQALALNSKRHPIERIGRPEEVAELALFLASARSAWITGAVHPIDGGASVTRR
jgi:NAD(P)-dependent dehydrogenase (short-subunit alcohol dehydrogenase family)